MDLQKRLIGESLRKKILDESHEEEDEEKELKRRATTFGASPAKHKTFSLLKRLIQKRTLKTEQGKLELKKIAVAFRDECLEEGYGKDNLQELSEPISSVTFTKQSDLLLFASGTAIFSISVQDFKTAIKECIYKGEEEVLKLEFTLSNEILVAQTSTKILVFRVSRDEEQNLVLKVFREVEAEQVHCFSLTN